MGPTTNPAGLRYTKDHEWVQLSDGRATVGITEHAQRQLGDIVYVELPEIGTRLTQGQSFGTIESVKAVSELYAPLSGQVADVNTLVKTSPERVNTDPYGSWMIALEPSDPGESAALLDAAQYTELTK